ncbi:1-phosphofructokinase family hexose kinase [Ruminococcaceae bacterium OttesenSCG-928-L11]|nr:1-phosphofructokinase family hexose kinase [Ruminococcaceae bacterium OttesenSCG-928-L11]
MITTVTMNPCIDWGVSLSSVVCGQLNLVDTTRTDVSGKGINVALVLRELGLEPLCTGLNFTGNGSMLEDRLQAAAIPGDFLMVPGNIRTNIKVTDTSKKEMTELNSRGEPVDRAYLKPFLEKLRRLAASSEIVTISGRLPNGWADDTYRQMIEALTDLSVKVVLDADKEPLRLAIQARPYLIKPNTYELETTFGTPIRGKQDIVEVCRRIIAEGVSIVCVSMGGEGAMIVDAAQAWYAPVLPIVPRGFPGAGDSMVAGLVRAMHDDCEPEEMLRHGMAASAASIIREGTLLCQRADYDRFLGQVRLERV